MLKFRHLKHVQYEMTRELLEQKRGVLEELERSELEAQRLQRALERVRIVNDDGSASERAVPRPDGTGPASASTSSSTGTTTTAPAPVSIAAAPPPAPRKSSSAGGLLGALSHTFHGIVDANPEAARRNNITKTREAINQVGSLIVHEVQMN